ncbi:MAG: glycerol kinase GlpK [Eubacterium sp.]|nr:glycerol kinase GlpK [Eubacterium sp.]
MKKYIMALDQGTTSCRSILFDHDGQIVCVAQKEFPQIYPQPGWVEHDPMEIWNTQLFVALESMRKAGAVASEIAAIGITNQRETTVVWDRETGLPVSNAIVWQCRRTAERIDELRDVVTKTGEAQTTDIRLFDYIHQTTGLIPDAYFSASKIEWILNHTDGAREKAEAGKLLFGTIDTWLIWNLTKGRVHATDRSNASRTMLYDIEKGRWDPKLLEVFRIPEGMLPDVKPSGAHYGVTDAGLFGEEIPICSAVGDQQSALFGHCCFAAGDVKNTYGTGCFLLMHTGEKKTLSEKGLLTTIAATTDDTILYALEGSVFAAGAAIQWLQKGLRLFEDAKETEAMALSVEDTDGVYVVPAFTGLGAPHWDPYARGTVVGITRGCTREHFVRATLESIAYQTKDILDVMLTESGASLEGLLVDGGVTKNRFLMQFQADIMGVPVIRPDNAEATAQGAAYLAGLTAGFWEDQNELKSLQGNRMRYEPKMDQETKNKLLYDWNRALERAKNWAEQ